MHAPTVSYFYFPQNWNKGLSVNFAKYQSFGPMSA